MAKIPAKLIEDTARELMARAAIDIPPDYREGVRLARDREKNRLARFVLDEMLENWDIATAERRPMCADTGLPRYYTGTAVTRAPRCRSPASSSSLRAPYS
jgi:L(+)-tartrate dehydratase alpha subunit